MDNCNVSLTSLIKPMDFRFVGFWTVREEEAVVSDISVVRGVHKV